MASQRILQDLQLAVDALEKAVGTSSSGGASNGSERAAVVAQIEWSNAQIPENVVANPVMVQMYSRVAIRLWNIAVSKSSTDEMDAPTMAKVRQLGLSVFLICNKQRNTPQVLDKKVTMAYKTAKAYIEAQLYDEAEHALNLAAEFAHAASKLQDNATDLTMRQTLASINCCQIQVAWSLGRHNIAFSLIPRVKELLPFAPAERLSLAAMCFNFACDKYYDRQYADAMPWLQESQQILEFSSDSPEYKSRQSRTLRLMACIYMDMGGEANYKLALECADNTLQISSDFLGRFLRLQALVLQDYQDDQLRNDIHLLLAIETLTLEEGLCAVDFLIEHKRLVCASAACNALESRFTDKSDVNSVRLKQLEILLASGDSVTRLLTAMTDEHRKGLNRLDKVTLQKLQSLLWKQGTHSYDAHKNTEAVEWYTHALALFDDTDVEDTPDTVALLKNLCLCALRLNQPQIALDHALHAAKMDPDDPNVYFLQFRIHLECDDEAQALMALERMCAYTDDGANDRIALAAQLAFEKKSPSLTVMTLEHTLQTLSGQSAGKQLIILRCLIRLRMGMLTDANADEQYNMRKLEEYFQTTHNVFTSAYVHNTSGNTKALDADANWFHCTAWNLGLNAGQKERALDSVTQVCTFFTYAAHIGRFQRDMDHPHLARVRMALVLAAQAALERAELLGDQTDKRRESLESVLESVSTARKVTDNLVSSSDKGDTTLLLNIYEFAAYALLHRSDDLKTLLKTIQESPLVTTDVLTKIAIIARDSGYTDVACNVLETILRREPDMQLCSQIYRTLVEAALRMDNKDMALQYISDAETVVKNNTQTYPETETAWLMTTAWNMGVEFHSVMLHDKALKWCSTAVRLLECLSSLKPCYHATLTAHFSEMVIASGRSQRDITALTCT